MIELAIKSKAEREKREWKRAAFIGYQRYILMPVRKGHARMDFERWLNMVGLGERTQPKPMTVKEEVSLVKRIKRMARRMVSG